MPEFLDDWIASLDAEQKRSLWEYFDGDGIGDYDVPHRCLLDAITPEQDDYDTLENQLIEAEVRSDLRILESFSRLSAENREDLLKKLTELYAS